MVASAGVLYGGLSKKNRDLLPVSFPDGRPVEPIGSLGDTPYVEVSYGIENIFKVFRIDFIHRLTYLDNPDVTDFGAKISFQFIL